MAHPDERMQRASHALAVDGNVWVVDPVDADGLDGELADTGFELVWEKDGAGWKEGPLYHPDRRALVVPDTLMTAFFAEVDGRLEVFPLFRWSPPRREFGSLDVDRVFVPGDGDNIVHHSYVEDVASTLRVVAEEGTPGEAYNVGARQSLTLDERLQLIADALDTDVELVHASDRELAEYDLAATDFPLVRKVPVIVDTAKLAALGWESTPHVDAFTYTVDEHREGDRTGRHHGPDREGERRAIYGLTT